MLPLGWKPIIIMKLNKEIKNATTVEFGYPMVSVNNAIRIAKELGREMYIKGYRNAVKHHGSADSVKTIKTIPDDVIQLPKELDD